MDRLGSYRLRKRIATGGMGEVFLGEKIGPEGFVKPVVLKCVLPQLVTDRAFIKLFEDEARLAALLNHPNIAQIYDFGVEDGTYYLAMEYVPGYTVDDIRRKLRSIGQHMPLQHIACIASQVCQGLHYAHTLTDGRGESLGLVHRDVSPHNLIVSVDGSVKIVDFGIAKARAGLTRVQAKGAVGKFGYMSPEQSRGDPVNGASDIFSLGVCLWELVTNERLNDPKLEKAPAYDPARPIQSPEKIRAEIPRQFLQILSRALSIRTEDRFRTAQDMHLALERFQAAMTHYAGQAALAGYIKDLVEGRVEKPDPAASGPMVQGVGGTGAAPNAQLEGAGRFEEVFGVASSGVPTPAARVEGWRAHASLPPEPAGPRVQTAPESWGSPSQRPEPPSRRSSFEGIVPSPIPLLESSSRPPPTPRLSTPSLPPARTRSATRPPRRRSYAWPIIVLLAGLIAAGVVFRAPLKAALFPPPPAPKPAMYRITSAPEEATVFVDGAARGKTPLELQLTPGEEYKIRVSHEGYRDRDSVLRAAPGDDVRNVPFKLKRRRRRR